MISSLTSATVHYKNPSPHPHHNLSSSANNSPSTSCNLQKHVEIQSNNNNTNSLRRVQLQQMVDQQQLQKQHQQHFDHQKQCHFSGQKIMSHHQMLDTVPEQTSLIQMTSVPSMTSHVQCSNLKQNSSSPLTMTIPSPSAYQRQKTPDINHIANEINI